MNRPEYIARKDQLIATFTKDNCREKEDVQDVQFNIVSASLSNFLPETEVQLHHKIYKKILLHQQLSILEQNCSFILDYVTCENIDSNMLQTLKKNPSLICTFHTGSYRMINHFLIHNNIRFSLVIAGKVKNQQGGLFKFLHTQLVEDGVDHELTLIDAESSSAGLQMLRELRQGKSLLVYIDGNVGAGISNTQNNNVPVVNFFQQQIFVRAGVAFLSHASGHPIIVAASYRKSFADIRLRFFDAIYPDLRRSRTDFGAQVMQKIYDHLAYIVARCPEQWEGWLYLHKSVHIIHHHKKKAASNSLKSTQKGLISFNCAEFGIFKIEEKGFLFRKSSYLSYPIDNPLYDFLSTCISKPLAVKTNALVRQLLKMNVVQSA